MLIDESVLSSKVKQSLKDNGFTTLEDLKDKSYKELSEVKGLGEKALKTLINVAIAEGIDMKASSDDYHLDNATYKDVKDNLDNIIASIGSKLVTAENYGNFEKVYHFKGEAEKLKVLLSSIC